MSDPIPPQYSPPPPTPPPYSPPPVEPPQRELVPLERIPMTPVTIGLAALAAVVFLVSLFRFPHMLQVGIANERGRQKLVAGDGAGAAALLAGVVKEFPKAKQTRMNLVRAYTLSGQYGAAAGVLMTFNGEKVDATENNELNELERELSSHFTPDPNNQLTPSERENDGEGQS